MSAEKRHVRHGIGCVRPYLYGNTDLPELVKQAFGAEELERVEMGSESFHIEARIGDSVVVLETGPVPRGVDATRASVYVYVEDVDAAYKKALECGATAIKEPEDKPYDERAAGVKDSFGNTWWISTYRRPTA